MIATFLVLLGWALMYAPEVKNVTHEDWVTLGVYLWVGAIPTVVLEMILYVGILIYITA